MKKLLPVLILPALLASCGRKSSQVAPGPLVDTAGALAEARRSDLQFASVRDTAGKTPATRASLDLRRAVEGTMERDVRAYRDTLRVEGASAVSRDGAVDWKATWRDGRFDRPALALAFARALVDSQASLVEWSLDTARDTFALRVVFQRPGPYGGPIDSARFAVGATSVFRVPITP